MGLVCATNPRSIARYSGVPGAGASEVNIHVTSTTALSGHNQGPCATSPVDLYVCVYARAESFSIVDVLPLRLLASMFNISRPCAATVDPSKTYFTFLPAAAAVGEESPIAFASLR
ncbi:hypothetical protein CDD83_4029 [Cordyceps sp. RAO-2017]|nr:hypothetical protein CDD83_4029 [Cordyceps sp. RAO-2017]